MHLIGAESVEERRRKRGANGGCVRRAGGLVPEPAHGAEGGGGVDGATVPLNEVMAEEMSGDRAQR
jgi:hypothetical protein